ARPRAAGAEAEEIEVVEQLDDVDLALWLRGKPGVLTKHGRPLRTEHRARLLEARLQFRVVAGCRLGFRNERLRLLRVLPLIVSRISVVARRRSTDRAARRCPGALLRLSLLLRAD